MWIASLALVDAISGITERSLKIRLIGSISNDEGDGNENDKKQNCLSLITDRIYHLNMRS